MATRRLSSAYCTRNTSFIVLHNRTAALPFTVASLRPRLSTPNRLIHSSRANNKWSDVLEAEAQSPPPPKNAKPGSPSSPSSSSPSSTNTTKSASPSSSSPKSSSNSTPPPSTNSPSQQSQSQQSQQQYSQHKPSVKTTTSTSSTSSSTSASSSSTSSTTNNSNKKKPFDADKFEWNPFEEKKPKLQSLYDNGRILIFLTLSAWLGVQALKLIRITGEYRDYRRSSTWQLEHAQETVREHKERVKSKVLLHADTIARAATNQGSLATVLDSLFAEVEAEEQAKLSEVPEFLRGPLTAQAGASTTRNTGDSTGSLVTTPALPSSPSLTPPSAPPQPAPEVETPTKRRIM